VHACVSGKHTRMPCPGGPARPRLTGQAPATGRKVRPHTTLAAPAPRAARGAARAARAGSAARTLAPACEAAPGYPTLDPARARARLVVGDDERVQEGLVQVQRNGRRLSGARRRRLHGAHLGRRGAAPPAQPAALPRGHLLRARPRRRRARPAATAQPARGCSSGPRVAGRGAPPHTRASRAPCAPPSAVCGR